MIGRGLWGLASQAISSLTNIGLGFAVARAVGQSEFGSFAIVMGAYLLALAAKNALISQPLLLRFSDPSREMADEASAGAMSASAVLGLSVGLVAGVVAVPLWSTMGRSLLVLGLGLAGLLVHDTMRHVFIGSGRPRRAAAADLAWALIQFPLLALVIGTVDDPPVVLLVAIWVGSGTVSGVGFALSERIMPDLSAGVAWTREQAGLGGSILVEQILITGSETVALWLIAVAGGLAAAGAVNGALLLVGPARVAGLAVLPLLVPELRSVALRDDGRFAKKVTLVACVLAGGLGLVGSVGAVFPDSVGVELLGETWTDASSLVVPLAAMVGAKAATNVFSTGMRLYGGQPVSLRIRLVAAPLSVLAAVYGASQAGAAGGVDGLWIVAVASAVVGGVACWRVARSGTPVEGTR